MCTTTSVRKFMLVSADDSMDIPCETAGFCRSWPKPIRLHATHYKGPAKGFSSTAAYLYILKVVSGSNRLVLPLALLLAVVALRLVQVQVLVLVLVGVVVVE